MGEFDGALAVFRGQYGGAANPAPKSHKRTMPAAQRERLRITQQKRWAEKRAAAATAAGEVPPTTTTAKKGRTKAKTQTATG